MRLCVGDRAGAVPAGSQTRGRMRASPVRALKPLNRGPKRLTSCAALAYYRVQLNDNANRSRLWNMPKVSLDGLRKAVSGDNPA